MNRSLVLSGGAAKIGFQLGVYSQLKDKHFNSFYGVSCGAILAAMLAQDKYELASNMILNLNNSDIYKGKLSKFNIIWKVIIGAKHLIDMSPLRNLLELYVKKEDFKYPAYFSYTDLNTGEFITVCSDDLETSKDIIDAIMASAAMPIIMPYVTINNKDYVDGGLKKTCPLSEAVKNKPDSIVVINCFNRNKNTLAPVNNILNITLHCVNDIMLEEMSKQSVNTTLTINNIISELSNKNTITVNDKIYKYIDIKIYEPDEDLGDSFNFNKNEMYKRYSIGIKTKLK